MANSTSTSQAQRAFEHAIAIYREQMVSEDFTRLSEISSLDHLVTQAQEICKALQPKVASTWESRANKLASNLEPFQRILQGVCNLAPMGGDLLWGTISFILETAKGNADVLEEVLGFLLGMTDEIEYLQVVEDTFDGSVIVVSAITAVYVAILEFWVKAIRYYTIKMKHDFITRIKSWFASSDKMAKEFVKLGVKISAAQIRLHQIETSQYHAYDKADRARHRQNELTQWIGAPDYKQDLKTAEEYRYPGTCEWLGGKQEFRDWTQGQASSLLIIYGTAGVGKTVLSSWIVNEAQHRSVQSIPLYHFFKETNDNKNTALAATRSLLDQLYEILLSTNHRLVATLESKIQAISRTTHVDFESLWEIFSSSLSEYSQGSTFPVTVILDAMDECKDSKQLVSNLQHLIHDELNKIRVVVTARPSGDHVDEFQRILADQSSAIFLKIAQDDVKDDIVAFVTHHITNIERLDNPKHYDLRDHVIAVLSDTKNHQGMFLWVYLACKEVECRLQVSAIRKLLDHLPKGLDGLYARICQRLLAKGDTDREFTRLVLQWIVASRRPMTFSELEEALRMEIVDSHSSGKDFFGQHGGLIWSRRDIVKSCGDLVQYSGLEEGDTIGIVHLSARQFLSSHSSQLFPRTTSGTPTIEPFLVNIRSAELRMGMSCIKFILSTTSHSKQYLSSPIRWDEGRTPDQNAFKERYPFFDYAALYWTEYTLNSIQSQPRLNDNELSQLLATVTEFTRSSASVIWLEELIRQTYIEFVQHILLGFTTLESTITSADILEWSSLVLRVLLNFSTRLSSSPQMVRLCVSQLQAAACNGFDTSSLDTPMLEADEDRCWAHYDPIRNYLYSVTYAHELKCQAMNTGVRLRPLLPSREKTQDGSFSFYTAAVNTSADLIAVTYLHDNNEPHYTYFTACWRVGDPKQTSDVASWATFAFSDSIADKRQMFSGNVIAFGKNDTIITPGGVFSLQTKECVNKPKAIYNPDPIFRVTFTCFSGHGERVARIRDDKMLEVLDICGAFMCAHELDGMSDVTLNSFSHTGTKAIVGAREGESLFCILVDEDKRIDMPVPSAICDGFFTRDEERFVACTRGWDNHQPELQVIVWTFLHDEDGSYHDHAYMIYIYDGVRFVFNLVPGTLGDLDEDVLIVKHDGRLIRRPLDVSSSNQEVAQDSWVLTWNHFRPELVKWSMKRSGGLAVETWSLTSLRPECISRIEHSILVTPGGLFEPSPDGSYLVTSRVIFDGTPSSLGACKLPKKMQYAKISMFDALLACLYDNNSTSTLCIFDIARGPRITQRASHTFDEYVHGLVFSNHDSNLLAVGNYIMRLDNRRLVVQAQLDFRIRGFSDCGLYCHSGWSFKIHQLQVDLAQEATQSSRVNLRHPTSMKQMGTYVYSPHILQLLDEHGVVSLNHKLIHENDGTYRSRIICILPNTLISTPGRSTLIWPENDADSLKVVAIVEERPILIDTGIKKDSLMEEDEWFTPQFI